MKKYITFIIFFNYILYSNSVHAQMNNNGIFFQAIARDMFTNPAKEKNIYLEASIIQYAETGNKVFTEQHQTNTDAFGVFNITLGGGKWIGGVAKNLTSIDWANGPFFLNIKISITPTAPAANWDFTKEWIDLGSTPFGTVPYALYSGSSVDLSSKLSIADTAKMLSNFASLDKLNVFAGDIRKKLNNTDTAAMLVPYKNAIISLSRVSIMSDSVLTKVNTVLDSKLNLSDSSIIFVTPYQLAAKTFDTSFLNNRINLKINLEDSVLAYVTPTQLASKTFDITPINTSISTKLNLTDTVTLSNRINLKLTSSDTATMLNNRISRDTSFLLQKRDTATLSSRINLKLTSSDTTSMLNNRISRDTSFLLQKRDTASLSTRINSKLDTSNKSINLFLTSDQNDIKFPSVKAVTDYVDSVTNTITAGGASPATAINYGLIKLNGDLSNTPDLPLITANAITSSKILDGTIATADLADASITNIKLAGSIPASKLIATDLTSLGTILTGTWSATSIDIAHGGTGAASAVTARTNLGLAIGSDILAFRTFGTAANNNTSDFDVPLSFSSPLSRSINTISMPSSSSSDNGYLSSTDWSIFNNKQALITPSNTINKYWNGYKAFVSLNTDSIVEGTTNKFYTDARARNTVALTVTNNSGASTYSSTTGILNIPTYTLAGLGGQLQLNGTGFVKATGTSISYDNATYLTGNQTITLSGDVIGSGTTSITTTVVNINGQKLASLSTGILKNTTSTGLPSIAIAGSDYENPLSFSSPLSRVTNTISIPVATTSANGYLNSTDWNTFNNKQTLITASNTINKYWNGYKAFVTLNTDSITEGSSNKFYTDAKVRTAFALTVTNNSGASTYNSTTGILNVPTYSLSGLGGQAQLNGTGLVKVTGTTISYDNATYINDTDTASMLLNRLKITDTSSMLSTRLKVADTSSMLSSRFARDTVALSNRINLKLDKINPTITGLAIVDSIKATRYSSLAQPTSINAASPTTINLSLGNIFTVSMGTTISSLTFSNPAIGTYLIKFVQDATGNREVTTWPANLKWAGGTQPAFTNAGTKIDIVTLIFDGTNYYGAIVQNF